MTEEKLKDNIREASFDNKISRPVAEEQFKELMTWYDVAPEEFSDKDIEKNFERIKNRFIRAMVDGKISIKYEDGKPQIIQRLMYPPQGISNTLTYRTLDGKARVAMKGHEEDDNHGRMQALCGALCGEGEAVMRSLIGPDVSLMEYIGGFFLQV